MSKNLTIHVRTKVPETKALKHKFWGTRTRGGSTRVSHAGEPTVWTVAGTGIDRAYATRNRLEYVTGLSILPAADRPGGNDPLLEGYKDADAECPHGRLPGDRTPVCGCWGDH